MAEYGIAVAAARREGVARLEQGLTKSPGAFPRAELGIEGMLESQLDGSPAVEVEAVFRTQLAESRPRDAVTGGAAIGPHRSDLAVRHLETGLPAQQCSTGEQKALLIAIVLADARVKGVRAGAAPALLLDEVVAHLDEERRAALLEEILDLGAQAWLTGTDRALFAALEGTAQFFEVTKGQVSLDASKVMG
jgi:DNA replication and repair protein RecF